MNTYTKLRNGNWGVRAQGAVKVGQVVTVIKKSGERKTETIAAVVWTDGKISLCAIGISSLSARSRSGRLPLGAGAGSASRVSGYPSYCTDNANCRCFDCAS